MPHCSCKACCKATKIARRLVHVRLGDLDVIEADDRIDLDRMRLRALAHDLPMNLAFGRHVDDEIAANPGLAAEPPAGGERSALRGVAALDRAPMASHDRRSNEWRAWRNRPRRRRPDSGRKCLARRRPNRDRRRARARLPSRLKPSANSPRLPEGVKTMRWVICHARESGHPEGAAMSCPDNPRQPGPPLSRG